MRVRRTEANGKEIMELITGRMAGDILDRVIAGPIEQGLALGGKIKEKAEYTYKMLNEDIDNFVRPSSGNVDRVMEVMKAQSYTMDQCTLFAMVDVIIRNSKDKDAQNVPVFPVLMAQKEGKVFRKEDMDRYPYLKEVKLQPWKEGSCKVRINTLPRNAMFLLGPSVIVDGIAAPRLGAVDHKVTYGSIETKTHLLHTDGSHPGELYLIQHIASQLSGRVLMLGCGLGSFVHAASMNENVTSIVVVEPNPDIAKIFTDHILPQFSRKNKVEKVEVADIYEYVSGLNDGDFAFVCANSAIEADPVRSASEAYIKLKSILCPRFKESHLVSIQEACMLVQAHALISDIIALEYADVGSLGANTYFSGDKDLQHHYGTLYEVCRDILAPVDFRTPQLIREYINPLVIKEEIDRYFSCGAPAGTGGDGAG